MKLALLLFLTVAALPSQVVIVSDIHFNPLADPALAPQLMTADPAQWEAIFKAASPQHVQKYGEDTSWPLFSALLSGVENVTPKPRLILFTGDILPHRFQANFAGASGSKDPADFRKFTKQTVDFVTLEVKKASGGAPVIFTLGNNDQECGDYALQPNGPFLRDIEPDIQNLAHLDAARVSSWDAIGSYSAPNPLASHHRILAINTTFWSTRYKNACGSESDPGETVTKWLNGQLADAQRRHDKVWLVLHIPPGIDGHSSARAGKTVSMWKPEYQEAFEKLLDRYGSTVEFAFAGHTHLDDIRLISGHLVLIDPGVSPNINQNPAFRMLTVDKHGLPKDLVTYYMPDLAKLAWQTEYDTRAAYGIKSLDAPSFEALYNDPSTAAKWTLYYAVSRPGALSNDKTYLRSLYCATGHADVAGYQACIKNQNP